MIRAVLFDVGGVLHASSAAMDSDLIEELGISEATLRKLWDTQIVALSTGEIDETEFWRQASEQYGIRHVENTENLLGRAFIDSIVEHTDTVTLASELQSQGLVVGILSNTIPPHSSFLRNTGAYDKFRPVILSHEVGSAKPDPSIYTKALVILGVKPDEVLFIDDLPENIAAANKAGIKGVLYLNEQQARNDVLQLLGSS